MPQTFTNASNVATFSTILAFRQSFSVDLRVTDGVKFDLTPIYPLKWQKRMVKLKTVGQKWAKCLKRCQLFDGASFLTKCLKRFQMPQTFTLFEVSFCKGLRHTLVYNLYN